MALATGRWGTRWVACRSPGREKAAYFFLSGRWESAEAAAVLESAPVLPLFSTFEAAFPAFSPVCSFFAIQVLLRYEAPTQRRVASSMFDRGTFFW